jgi:hypothetical protein
MVLGMPVFVGGNTAKPDCGTKAHTQNVDVSTSGKTSVKLQSAGDRSGPGVRGSKGC